MFLDVSRLPHSYDVLRVARREGRRIAVAGVLWLVYEVAPFTYDRSATSSLVFEDDWSVVRVRSFPAGWRSLNDEQLFALMDVDAVPNAARLARE
jgi:hypothetical protein